MHSRYSNKKIAIVGANYLQLPLVLKAKDLGIESHCFAWEEGAVCKPFVDFFYPISTTSKEEILKICSSIKINGITSIASDVAVPTVNYVAHNLDLVGNDPKDSLALTNKYLMREKFFQNHINSPKFHKVEHQRLKKCNKSLKFPLIVKPVDRSGSRGVQKVSTKTELSKAIKNAINESFSKGCIVEEFIEGYEVSVESISWKGEHHILAITDKETTGRPHFVEIAHHQPTMIREEIQSILKNETLKCLNSLNIMYGASHSEFKITYDGDIYVIEVGARMGGDFIGSDLTILSTGYDFLKAVIDVSLGFFERPKVTARKCSGIYFLCKEREYLKPMIEEKTEKYIVEAEITDTEIRKVKSSSDRSGYLIYQNKERILL